MVSYFVNEISGEEEASDVLILIVVEDGLVLVETVSLEEMKAGLNPYCSGRWSRTLMS